MSRKLLVWMYAPEYPIWSMPEGCRDRIASEAGEEWTLRFLEEEGYFAGDGARRVPDPLVEEIRDAEVYWGFGIPREAFRAAERLRWFHSGAAGVGSSLFPEMRESDVLFTNSSGIHAEPLSDYALAVMLHFARGLDVAASARERREWSHGRLAGKGTPVRELAGRTVGVVGYGGIGSAVGRKAAALGMRVVATRRDPSRVPEEAERVRGPEELDRLLEASDYVVLTVPETPDTRGLIGEAEIGRMDEGAVLINVSRGGIVEEEALARALEEGRLRGAGLDVFEREPLPPESPFWELENAVVTPHSGAVSPRFWQRETDLMLRNFRRYLEGRPLANVVDKNRGY